MGVEDFFSGVFGGTAAGFGNVAGSLGSGADETFGSFASSDAGGAADFGAGDLSSGISDLGSGLAYSNVLSDLSSGFQSAFSPLSSFFGGASSSEVSPAYQSSIDATAGILPNIVTGGVAGVEQQNSFLNAIPIFGEARQTAQQNKVVSGSNWWRPLQFPSTFVGTPASPSSFNFSSGGGLLILLGLAVVAVVLVAKKR